MIRFEIGLCSLNHSSLGIFIAEGVDEQSREFKIITLGFLLFEISILKYDN